jgi:Fe-S-cluster containining protein
MRCGACCCNPEENRREGFGYWVEIEPRDAILRRSKLVARLVTHDDEGVPHLRLDDQGRCVALRGKLGNAVRCSIYADRPRACRRVEAGSERCLQYRAERDIADRSTESA